MDFSNIKLKDIDIVFRTFSRSLKWERTNATTHIMGVQLTGSALHTFDYKEFTIDKNCIYFLNQKDDYRVKVFEKTEAFSVHFTTYEPIETDSFCIKLTDISEIESVLDKMLIQKNFTSKGDNLAASYFYKLCDIFETICDSKYFKKDKRLIDAKKYIDSNYKEKACLDKASVLSGLSRRRFNELFKQQFNITPNRYITVKKIEFSKKLLDIEYMSISEIATLCGFGDVYYFSNAFKKETGLSPSAYRHAVSNEGNKP